MDDANSFAVKCSYDSDRINELRLVTNLLTLFGDRVKHRNVLRRHYDQSYEYDASLVVAPHPTERSSLAVKGGCTLNCDCHYDVPSRGSAVAIRLQHRFLVESSDE